MDSIEQKKRSLKKKRPSLVEGYTDLIVMNQYGFTNTIATLGTACTQDHLKSLSRYAQRLYLLYDGDAADKMLSCGSQNSAGR